MVVEKTSGKPFGQFLHDRIFAPLKMSTSLAYQRGNNEVRNRAYGYTKDADGWRETDQTPTSAVLGDGGGYTSLDDMAKWDTALRRHTLLCAQEMEAALTPVNLPATAPDGSLTGYGFGWFLDSYQGHARDLSIIVLCNRTDVSPQELALKVADMYLAAEKLTPP